MTRIIPDGVSPASHDTFQATIRTKVDAAAQQTNTIVDSLAREKLLSLAGPMT